MQAPCRLDNNSLQDNRNLSTEFDDEYTLVSAQVKHYIMNRGIPIVSALGLVGNLLALMVLTKERLDKSLSKMEISAHIGLIALAVSDFLFCLSVLLVTTVPEKEFYEVHEYVAYYHLISRGLITVFIICSTWLIVVMAAERYVAVCHPLRARNLISLWRTRAYVIILFIVCPLCTIPVFLERSLMKERCPDGHYFYQFVQAPTENVAVRRIVWALFFDFVPCVALVYFNTCLIWKIHKAKQLREQMAPLQAHSGYHEGASPNSRRYRWGGNSKQSSPIHASKKTLASGRGALDDRTHISNGRDQHEREFDSYSSKDHSQINANAAGSHHEMKLLCSQNGKNCFISLSSPHRSGRQKLEPRSLRARRRCTDNALNSVTATLVAVVLTFLILVSPWELLKFGLQYSSSPMDKYKTEIALYITNFMQVLNFSFNFVLYCVVNKSFRRTFCKLFFCAE